MQNGKGDDKSADVFLNLNLKTLCGSISPLNPNQNCKMVIKRGVFSDFFTIITYLQSYFCFEHLSRLENKFGIFLKILKFREKSSSEI